MSITALLIGIAVIALLGGTVAVASAIPFVCGAFAFCFWGSLAILAISVVGGAIVGMAEKDFDVFSSIAGFGFLICLCGLAFALLFYFLAYFVDGARVLLSIFGMDAGQAPITMERMFFPWSI